MKNYIYLILISCMLLVASGMSSWAQESHPVQESQEPRYVQESQEPNQAQDTRDTQDAQNVKVTKLEKKYTIYFRVNESHFDPTYLGNARTMETMVSEISSALDQQSMVSCQIAISASASPEGRYHHNEQLSKRRMDIVLSYLTKNIDVTDVTFHTNSLVEDWTIVATYVAEDQQVPRRQEVLQVINSFDGTQDVRAELQKIGDGAYDYILENLFPLLRSTEVVAVYDISERVARDAQLAVQFSFPAVAKAPQPQLERPAPAPAPAPQPCCFQPFMKVKTNIIGIGMGHANIAVEYAFAEHFSVALPFYYSGGFDYFKPTVKFRGIVLQPEARYYVKGNEGFYFGAHLGLGWYNFALDGTYRIQDHKGRTPAYGGGLGLGYALQFKKNPKWGMEFAIGAGVYNAKYDIFYNEHNGPYAETGVQKIFVGIDNASLAFTYKFDINRKGGKR